MRRDKSGDPNADDLKVWLSKPSDKVSPWDILTMTQYETLVADNSRITWTPTGYGDWVQKNNWPSAGNLINGISPIGAVLIGVQPMSAHYPRDFSGIYVRSPGFLFGRQSFSEILDPIFKLRSGTRGAGFR